MAPSAFRTFVTFCTLAVLLSILTTCGGGSPSIPSGNSSLGTPHITSLSPASAPAGGQDFVLSVYGSNLSVDHSVVCWNGQERATGLNCVGFECLSEPPHVDAQISASDIARQGTAQVTVYNPGSAQSNALTFVIGGSSSGPSCTMCIEEIVPSEVAAGSPAFTVTVNGSGFYSGVTVMWDNMINPTSNFQRPTTFISANQVVADIPASDVQTAGSAYVYVMDSVGGVWSKKWYLQSNEEHSVSRGGLEAWQGS
jgi:hypothetical protein